MAEQRKRKKRMTLPKKKEDIEKVVEEVSERHGHEHEHHHHHHGDIDELLTVIELLLDSTNATVKVLDSKVKHQANEIATLYRVLAKVIEACLAAENQEERRARLLEALEALGVAPSEEARAF
ncbi:MAG: hypothetical protein F7C38_00825 [Desulfurococcales archaeon]|nr:hypothetical protein [Desulfurococcales archaeon]